MTLQDTLEVSRDWVYTAGTVDAGSSTVRFSLTSGTATINSGSVVFNQVDISTTDDTVAITGTMNIEGSLMISSVATINTGTIAAQGPVVSTDAAYGGTGKLLFTGTMDQIFDLTGATDGINLDIDVNKSGGDVNLVSAITLDEAGQDLTIVEGTFDINSNNLTFSGNSFTVQDGGVYQLAGGETSSTPTLSSGSTVNYDGSSGRVHNSKLGLSSFAY